MKSKISCLLALITLSCLCSTCSVRISSLSQKATKKCKACENFLAENKIFKTLYKEYDKVYIDGVTDVRDVIDPNGKNKTNFMDAEDHSYLYYHKYCFIGMRKAEIEQRFNSSIRKDSYPATWIEGNKWHTAYRYNVGTTEKDSTITVAFSIVLDLYYDIINGDTIYSPERSEIASLKECLDAEGVRYKE